MSSVRTAEARLIPPCGLWRALRAGILLAVGLTASPAKAEPLAPRDVPEPLRPWIGWVMRGHESELCPTLIGDANRLIAPFCADRR